MDFKGITWAGNIYQKFEAMCLEVEEVMYEDTVKFMENQVQKAGVSVKKFYSEVVQDLLPPSCVDPVKGDMLLKPYTQSDINKKPKLSIVDMHGELTKKDTEDESPLTSRNDTNRLSPLFPNIPVTSSDVCSIKSKKLGAYKRSIGIKRISKNNHPPKISRAMTSLSGDFSEFFVTNDPGEAVTENAPISDASVESFNSIQDLSAESLGQEKNDSESVSSASDEILSAESLRQKNNGSACDSSTEYKFRELREDWPLSQVKSNICSDTCKVESASDKVIASYEDNFDIEVIETEDVLEPGVELSTPVEKSNLEETCILVEVDKLHFVSCGTKKHKSYKKKIREALSSKLRSPRKQDLGEKNDTKMVIPVCAVNSVKTKSPADDSCESDWELL